MPITLKKWVARLLHWRLLRWLLQIGVRLFAPTHRVGVIAIVFDNHGRVLLLNHVYHPGLPWGPPGGWLDKGEHPADGVMRELREETGLAATSAHLLLLDRNSRPSHIEMAFGITLADTQPAEFILSGEIISARWFELDDMPYVAPFVQRAIATAVRQQQPEQPADKKL